MMTHPHLKLHPSRAIALLVAPLAACAAHVVSNEGAECQQPRTLEASGSDTFPLELGAGQFVAGEVLQLSVDVVITIIGPDGEVLGQFDERARGPDLFEFETDASGLYQLRIEPYEGSGDYVWSTTRSEPIADRPAGRIDQIMHRYDGFDRPGAMVAHVKGGEVAYEAAYGMADLNWGIPNGGDVKYDIASVSKPFTAFAILLLEQRGLLGLDDDVRQHLPEVPDFGQTVTLRNLITHTSGYRETMDLLLMGGREPEDQFDMPDALVVLEHQTELHDPPGWTYRYNNTGYMLLAQVVERVGGEPFDAWMRANVFGPLGMLDTEVRSSRGKLIEGAAEGYIPSAEGYRRAIQNAPYYGPSNVHTTPRDLAKWMRNLATADLGGRELIDSMLVPHALESGEPNDYGLGWHIDEDRGLRRIQHSGGGMAFRCWFAYYPELDEGFILHSNTSAFHRGAVSAVAEALFGDRMETPAERSPAPASALPEPWSPTPAELDACAGRYFSDELEAIYQLVAVGGRLYARHRRLGDRPLSPTSRDRFRCDFPFDELVLTRSPGGSDAPVTGFAISTDQNPGVRFERMN